MKFDNIKYFTAELFLLSQLSQLGVGRESSRNVKDTYKGANVSAEKSFLFGPALNPKIITPAKYLYIQAVSLQGANITRSTGSSFDVQIFIEHEGRRSRLRSEVRDRGDGTYQIFFYYGIQPDSLVISVRLDGQYVGGTGPLVIKNAEVEQCYCPKKAKKWTQNYECSERELQVDMDLSKFRTVDKALLNRTFETLVSKEACFVHYIIRSNRIYGKAYGR